MAQQPIQFLFGDRELVIDTGDILEMEAEVIVSSCNGSLTHEGGVSRHINQGAGVELNKQCSRLITEYGHIDSGMAVYTSAGKLAFKSIIHAVGPCMGEGEEQRKLEQAISRSLQLCEINQWHSIAFPAISTGHFNVPVSICAQAFFRSITRFWDARHESDVEKIILCLTQNKFDTFVSAFREDALESEHQETREQDASPQQAGEVDLSDMQDEDLHDDDMQDWFK